MGVVQTSREFGSSLELIIKSSLIWHYCNRNCVAPVVGFCPSTVVSIVGVLILDVADEDFVLLVPALEVATSESQQILRRIFLEHHDIFLCYVA